MQFNQDFEKDLAEAHEWWAQHQNGQVVPLDEWVARLLAQHVYALLAEKRVKGTANGPQEGRQGETNAH
jgi:hypothetical protein